MKPAIINAFVGDSIIVRCAIFDEQNQAYSPLDDKLDRTWMLIEGIGQIDGSVVGNVLQFIIPMDVTQPGKNPKFIIQISDMGIRKITVSYGTICLVDQIMHEA